jgi:isoleucyl-tRNA synthetase
MDITKDRLYCEAQESRARRATQSAMTLIARSMLTLVAPVLTYTADEILDYAPAIFREGRESVFDLVYEEIPEVAESFDEVPLIVAREKFYEVVDRLKKEKTIKSTLELEIAGDIGTFAITDAKDLEDWFVVSALKAESAGEQLGAFETPEGTFTIHRATAHKCPRCWRFTAKEEGSLCERCAEVIDV